MKKPLIFFDPYPRTKDMVFTPDFEKKLKKISSIKSYFGKRAPDKMVDAILPNVEIIIGQTSMNKERFNKSTKLKAIINVKGNWENNIDYLEAKKRGIYVLSAAPAMAPAVAELSLGYAIALSRNIIPNHNKFIQGKEKYNINGNKDSYNLINANVGFIGFGNLGKSLLKLLKPFECKISVYDPWISEKNLMKFKVIPSKLNFLLKNNKFIFILAGVTKENKNFLNQKKLNLIKKNTSVILISRAEVVDFDSFVNMAENGCFRAAIDVFPTEPVSLKSGLRKKNNIIYSSHLAGGMNFSYKKIREMLMCDIPRILKDEKPIKLQFADQKKVILRIDR